MLTAKGWLSACDAVNATPGFDSSNWAVDQALAFHICDIFIRPRLNCTLILTYQAEINWEKVSFNGRTVS